jgi:hypothetical protein
LTSARKKKGSLSSKPLLELFLRRKKEGEPPTMGNEVAQILPEGQKRGL